LFISAESIDRSSGKKKERSKEEKKIVERGKKTKDLMKIDGRKNLFAVLFLLIS